MKNIFIIISFLFFSSAFSQKKIYVFNIELNHFSNAPKFIAQGNELEYSGVDNKEKAFFEKYTIISFEQSYPNSKKAITLNFFTVKTSDSRLMIDMVNNFPDRYLLYEDMTGMEITLLDTYTNDYGNTIPDTQTNLGVDFAFHNLDYIHAPKAWDYTLGDESVKIGISDMGLSSNDADLSKTSFISPSSLHNVPYDSLVGETFHGSSVAAIAAATGNNAHGMTGVCPQCDIIATNVGYNGLLLLEEAGAKIINMSWVTSAAGYSEPLPLTHSTQLIIDELYERGVILIGGSGNWGSWNDGFNGSRYYYPASHNHVISVLSVNSKNNFGDQTEIWEGYTEDVSIFVKDMISPKVFTDFEGNGPAPTYTGHTCNDLVDICAPGYALLRYGRYVGEGIVVAQESGGTSSSAPHIAGTVGLMISLNDCLISDEVESILKLTSKNIEILQGNEPFIGKSGSGKLETGDAVEFVYEMKDPNGNAVIDGQDFYRFNFNLKHINNKLTISNQKFRNACTADFTAKKIIEILPGSDFNPNGIGFVDLKIDAEIDITCTGNNDRVAVKGSKIDNKLMVGVTTSKLYPNPNNGTFNIVMVREIKENINVEVYDVFGKVVYKDIKQGANFSINALDLSSGMYIVRLSSGDYNETIKFIKE